MVLRSNMFVVAALATCLISSVTAAPQKPKFEPVRTLERHLALLKQGVALHDEGDYDGAISAYQEVLRENPDDISAQFELSFSYFQKKDFENCIKTAQKGTTYISDLLVGFYIHWGSCVDDSGKPKQAVEVLRRGLKVAPDHPQLQFNIGVTYKRMGDGDKAKEHFKEAIVGDPQYVSAHLALANEYLIANQRVPALLALLRFLSLEPASPRSKAALEHLRSILQAQVKQEGENNLQILLNPDSDSQDGDFSAADMVLAIGRAVQFTEARAGRSELEHITDQLSSLFEVLGRSDETEKTGFARDYYVPYFAELGKNEFDETLVYYIHQSTEAAAVTGWLDKNHVQVQRFEDWSRSYENWPVKLPRK